MADGDDIKSLILPKFVVHKFNLKKCNIDELHYTNRFKVLLKDYDDNPLQIKDTEQLMSVLTYYRIASKVCLDLIYKHIADKNTSIYDLSTMMNKKLLDSTRPDVVKLPLKKRQKRRFFDNISGVKVKDLIDVNALENDRIELGDKSLIISESDNKVNLTLRFGTPNNFMKRRPSRYLIEVCSCEDNLPIKNDFYRHLIFKTVKPSIWQKTIMFLFGYHNLRLIEKYKKERSEKNKSKKKKNNDDKDNTNQSNDNDENNVIVDDEVKSNKDLNKENFNNEDFNKGDFVKIEAKNENDNINIENIRVN